MKKPLRAEYLDAPLGDARRSDRLAELAIAMAALPGASFPQVLGDGAALEAAYRFLGNEEVDAIDMLQPHQQETVARAANRDVVVAHDTTEFKFPGTRRGLGRLRGSADCGFLAHVALAVSWDQWREPLGVLHLETWTRGAKKRKSRRKAERDPTRESTRWGRGVEAVEEQLGRGRAIHVMDREADDYDLLVKLATRGSRYVIRSNRDRRVDDGTTVAATLASRPHVVTREVPLSRRADSKLPGPRKAHPPRSARDATLAIKAATVTVVRPCNQPIELPPTLEVHVVSVDELGGPAGEASVSWRLYTTEPIDTAVDLERIVDAYRCRWLDEELFKTLKTGCSIEKRQLETAHSLMNALALFIPIAWRALRHRSLAQTDPSQPASRVLSKLQLRVLRRAARTKLPASLTVADALVAIAALGGHLKRNGPPGWITILRGYERLLNLEEGFALAEM